CATYFSNYWYFDVW
nr:immunoglobulin heavy chain junction region [Mus musculus]MBK4185773.1 immunoglobulin heavy chain junction region [Mus musculus]